MSSFVRRMQRQVMPSQKVHVETDLGGEPIRDRKGRLKIYANPPRRKFYMGRGDKLGVFNPKGHEYLARVAREAKRKARFVGQREAVMV